MIFKGIILRKKTCFYPIFCLQKTFLKNMTIRINLGLHFAK
jgi:hypothetical protein